MVVIGAAAVAGYILNELATLAVGVAASAVLAGLVAYRILGRRRPWIVATCVLAIALPVFGLGLLKIKKIPRCSEPVAAAPPSVTAMPASRVNAGRQFDQQKANGMRDFRGADLRGAQFVNLDLKGFDFSGANAAGASFYGSRLDRAAFFGTNLGGAVLTRVCLHNATLRGADLTGVIATEADVSGVEVTPAETSAAYYWPPPGTPSPACT
ncbi:MAG: pentapeptide repeat-containing protein [Pseudonocardiales bacterium]|nr:pentapeptide repeat-containing protein [Pseudonocardiales bacterium]